MPFNVALLPEFDHEMANARKTLERVPEDKLAWKPHVKSPTMGWLASHLAELPTWTVVAIQQDSIDLQPPGGSPPRGEEASNRQELLARFDGHVAAARAAIAGATDEEFMRPWSLLKAGQTLMTLPKVAVVRTWVLNHMIHHRAQLGVYLRLNDIPVPAMYGPSADESPF
jgi:uncharacterized damage-inducible protein DinB